MEKKSTMKYLCENSVNTSKEKKDMTHECFVFMPKYKNKLKHSFSFHWPENTGREMWIQHVQKKKWFRTELLSATRGQLIKISNLDILIWHWIFVRTVSKSDVHDMTVQVQCK